jgi:hypothetical protein
VCTVLSAAHLAIQVLKSPNISLHTGWERDTFRVALLSGRGPASQSSDSFFGLLFTSALPRLCGFAIERRAASRDSVVGRRVKGQCSFPMERMMWQVKRVAFACALMALLLAAQLNRARADTMLVANPNAGEVDAVALGGTVTPFATGLSRPFLVAAAPDKTVYVQNTMGGESQLVAGTPHTEWITRISPAGQTSTLISGLDDVTGMAVDPQGNLVLSNYNYYRDGPSGTLPHGVLKFAPDGTLLASTPTINGAVPVATTLDMLGNLYAAFENGDVDKVSSSGNTSFIANIKALEAFPPYAIIWVDRGANVYATFELGAAVKITPEGLLTPLSYAGNYLGVDRQGNVYSAPNAAPHTISQVAPDGTTSVYATTSFTPYGLAFLVPEPGSVALAAMGFAGLMIWVRRRATGVLPVLPAASGKTCWKCDLPDG